MHVMDGERCVALVETRTLDTAGNDGTSAQLIRYQFGNHLGSASLELDDRAQIISYEEYTPYGSTSYQAVASQTETPKRYRYTGKERDEETGFSYHGARYYVPWLCRWSALDPAGLVDGTNMYAYVRGNPVMAVDPTGQAGQSITVDTQVNVVSKNTGKLENVENSRVVYMPEVSVVGDANAIIPASDGWPEIEVLPGTAEYEGRTAHYERRDDGTDRVVVDPTDAQLFDQAIVGTLQVISNLVTWRSRLGLGTGVARWAVSGPRGAVSAAPGAVVSELASDAREVAAGAGTAESVASETGGSVAAEGLDGPWIGLSRSKAEADAFRKTMEQIEGRLPPPPPKLGGGPNKWGSEFRNDPLQPGRAPELPPGTYEEYTTLLPGQTTRGSLRTVTGADGKVFRTWTHYGQNQPFYPIDPTAPLPRVTFLRSR